MALPGLAGCSSSGRRIQKGFKPPNFCIVSVKWRQPSLAQLPHHFPPPWLWQRSPGRGKHAPLTHHTPYLQVFPSPCVFLVCTYTFTHTHTLPYFKPMSMPTHSLVQCSCPFRKCVRLLSAMLIYFHATPMQRAVELGLASTIAQHSCETRHSSAACCSLHPGRTLHSYTAFATANPQARLMAQLCAPET